MARLPFAHPAAHGFARVAAAVPRLHLVDPPANAADTVALATEAAADHAALVVFPELGLTGYSAQDLFHQQPLLTAAVDALEAVRAGTAELPSILVVGLPLRVGSQLFNVAAVLHRGRILGVVPKSYLPNYREFYEKRHFSAARQATVDSVRLLGEAVPFGVDLLFAAADLPDLVVAVEICEDLWVPVPPSTWSTLAGATVVANPSGSNVTIGKAGYREELCRSQSARSLSAYVYAGSGYGESTTDLAWDGHAIIAENGNLLAEGGRFARGSSFVTADVDLDRLIADRVRTTSFADTVEDHRGRLAFRRVEVDLGLEATEVPLRRRVDRFPFVPSNPTERDERCAEVYAIQRSGLATRLAATGLERVVIGVSGGLDSTHALLVAVGAMEDLGLPRSNVLAFTMPGFATSDRTLADARRLMATLGVTAHEVDIRPAATQMLVDLDHPAARGEPVYDLTYENVQAGARTSLLFRLANHHEALVVGTGDLSELALGWCTYGVGDHMSHYAINASVPKTLIQHVIRWVAQGERLGPEVSEVLLEILATDISPELVPGDGDRPAQATEEVIGPYALHDFYLYYTLRFGYPPPKVAFLAWCAWHDAKAGAWPDVPEDRRPAYDAGQIKANLRIFLDRFFRLSQFKRSCIPNAPKVGSGGSLSPRGDWRAPSDSEATAWLRQLDLVPDAD
jgi:NAD+ synthase (glutamine-hydrolysing)